MPERITCSRPVYEEIRQLLIGNGNGGIIDDRVPEIEMFDVVLTTNQPRRSGVERTDLNGRAAYAAYCEAMGGSMPAWEDLVAHAREVWRATADAVVMLQFMVAR